jgi:hypothetical protein
LERYLKANVGSFEKEPLMLIAEKIPPPRRLQIFNDNAAIDAALAEQQEKHDHWVRYLMEDLASAIRKIGGRKPS